MLYCPYCGTEVKKEETFCVTCGRQLPNDISKRMKSKKQFNKIWYIPLLALLFFLLSSGIYYLYLQNQTAHAKDLYERGEKSLENGDYEDARDLFNKALKHKHNFPQADIASNYVDVAITIKAALNDATAELEQENFQEALAIISEAENKLRNYTGTEVVQLIDTLASNRNTIKIEQLKKLLGQNPTIEDLKILLWEADAIKNPEAEEITADIRNQIIDYTFSKASDQLNKKQFNDAQTFVEDGIKYAPDSEKLQSLKTTIEKEKFAFETTQQERLEQAINTAEEEREVNENDAIMLVEAHVENDDQGNLVIKGEVKSVATIPIHSVQINYSLSTKKGKEILSNEVFVYPDTLYPNETGKFEFTHFDIDEAGNNIEINVQKTTWYTN